MVKTRKYPQYNPDLDGNIFAWIMQTSAQMRSQQRPQKIRVDPLTGKPAQEKSPH